MNRKDNCSTDNLKNQKLISTIFICLLMCSLLPLFILIVLILIGLLARDAILVGMLGMYAFLILLLIIPIAILTSIFLSVYIKKTELIIIALLTPFFLGLGIYFWMQFMILSILILALHSIWVFSLMLIWMKEQNLNLTQVKQLFVYHKIWGLFQFKDWDSAYSSPLHYKFLKIIKLALGIFVFFKILDFISNIIFK